MSTFPRTAQVTGIVLAASLVAVSIGALVVITRESPVTEQLDVPAPPPPAPAPLPVPMPVATSLVTPPVTPAVPAAKPAWLTTLWATQDDAELTAIVPPGPFASLTEICAAWGLPSSEPGENGDACRVLTGDDAQTATVRVEQSAVNANVYTTLYYVAVKARGGWYAMPFSQLTMLNRSGFSFDTTPADGALVLAYHQSEGNRFDSESESGLVVCSPAGDAVACTKRIRAASFQETVNTAVEGWTSSIAVDLACDATYARGAITVAPTPKSQDTYTWSAAAAASCKRLAYAGTHPVKLPAVAAAPVSVDYPMPECPPSSLDALWTCLIDAHWANVRSEPGSDALADFRLLYVKENVYIAAAHDGTWRIIALLKHVQDHGHRHADITIRDITQSYTNGRVTRVDYHYSDDTIDTTGESSHRELDETATCTWKGELPTCETLPF